MPSCLSSEYCSRIDTLGLRALAADRPTSKRAIGGATEEESNQHFALMFPTSSGRIIHVFLDPLDRFGGIASFLQTTFADGHISLLDIPCGAGATGATLISLLVELRECGALPRLPLTVTILAGDISTHALKLYEKMISGLAPRARAQAVEVQYSTQTWDATRADSTARLVDRWFNLSSGCEDYVVIVANFSGEAHRQDFFMKIAPNLEQVVGRLYDKNSTFLWVEPRTNQATGYLGKVASWLKDRVQWFVPVEKDPEELFSDYKMTNPISNVIFPSGVTVKRVKRL